MQYTYKHVAESHINTHGCPPGSEINLSMCPKYVALYPKLSPSCDSPPLQLLSHDYWEWFPNRHKHYTLQQILHKHTVALTKGAP